MAEPIDRPEEEPVDVEDHGEDDGAAAVVRSGAKRSIPYLTHIPRGPLTKAARGRVAGTVKGLREAGKGEFKDMRGNSGP